MHIWTIEKWTENLEADETRSDGLRLRFDKKVDTEVREAFLRFVKWLRKEYYFPLRIVVYVKESARIKAKDGELVVGTFFEPYEYSMQPHVRVATGDYLELKNSIGRDDALASILMTLAHELTHYFQWINNLDLTPLGRERQATRYSHFILDEYAETCEHP